MVGGQAGRTQLGFMAVLQGHSCLCVRKAEDLLDDQGVWKVVWAREQRGNIIE